MTAIEKIDKYATEIKKMLDTLDAKTEVQYYCEFGNEELEELFLEKLEDISIVDDDGEEKYLLGNVDTLVEEFFRHPEVIKERLQFYDESEEDDEEDDEEVEDEEIEDDEDPPKHLLSREEEAELYDDDDFEDEEIDVSTPFDDQDDELCELNSDLEGEEEDEELEEDKNYINFYVQLADDRYININYSPQFDENFNIIGVVRDITLDI